MKKSLIVLPALLLLLVGMVSAVCTFISPGASDTLTGTDVINVSCPHDEAYENCSITATSALSGGSITALLLNDSSLGDASVSGLNITIDTSSEYDAADWVFSGTCMNATVETTAITSRTGETIDNGAPKISACAVEGSTLSANNTVVSESTVAYTCTIENATACNAYWKTSSALAFASSAASRTDLALNALTFTSTFGGTGTTATATLSGVGDNADYVYIDCSDGTDTSVGTVYTIKAEGDLGGSTGGTDDGTTGGAITFDFLNKLAENKIILFVLLASAFVIVLSVAFVMQKKRR